MEIIVPCAGLSTRFPNVRPKYLLTAYDGEMMVQKAVKNFIDVYSINIVILKQHDIQFDASKKLKDVFKFNDNVNIIILDEPTSGPADTVYQAIKKANLNPDERLLIKDCDSFYDAFEIYGNSIFVSKLSDNPNLRNVSAKSYVISNDQNIVSSIIEKKIVSDYFCVGGYQFESIKKYIDSFDNLTSTQTNEIFVSDIIDYMLSNEVVFIHQEVDNFVDVGTLDDWRNFNDKPTYFCDIDGTIVKTKFGFYHEYEVIQENVDTLLKKIEEGCKVIFCTARSYEHQEITMKMLKTLGFTNYQLVMDVNHSRRILINDYANSNPYPSAVAINIERDSNKLKDML